MGGNKARYKHLMLFFYRKGKNVTQAANKIRAVYADGAIVERIVRKWFARFKADDSNLEDKEPSGMPSTLKIRLKH